MVWYHWWLLLPSLGYVNVKNLKICVHFIKGKNILYYLIVELNTELHYHYQPKSLTKTIILVLTSVLLTKSIENNGNVYNKFWRIINCASYFNLFAWIVNRSRSLKLLICCISVKSFEELYAGWILTKNSHSWPSTLVWKGYNNGETKLKIMEDRMLFW